MKTRETVTLAERALIVLILAVMMAACCVVWCATAEETLSLYANAGVVFDIDTKEDVIYLMTLDGNVWVWEGVEDWMIGDVCGMLMDSNDTEWIKDDTIVSLRYLGWLDLDEV